MSPAAEMAWEATIAPDRAYYDTNDHETTEFPEYWPPRTFALRLPELRIGRSDRGAGIHPEIDLSGGTEDRGVSHLHAFLTRREDGSYSLVDADSSNGTRINRGDTPIEPHAEHHLRDGDEIHLGFWTTIKINARRPSFGAGSATAPAPSSSGTMRIVRQGDADPPPSAVVWLLCADIAEASVLLQRSPDQYAAAIDEYQRMLEESCSEVGGRMISAVDDTAVLRLPDPKAAIDAALRIQDAFASGGMAVYERRVRVGIHAESSGGASTALVSPLTSGATRAVCLAAHGGQVLVSEAAQPMLEAVLTPEQSLESLGPHRLTDLLAPQELYQLVDPSLERDFPQVRSLDSRPHNLPERLTRFIGRDGEIDRLKALIDDNRLCTVTGSGGAGKTRLALQVAARDLVLFPDGVWFVDLSETGDADQLAAAVAGALEIRQGGSGTYAPGRHEAVSQTDRIVDHLLHRKALLVLDRCEHLIEASAGLVDDLLRECSALRVLVTSREALRLPGEAVLHLGPLDLPSKWATTTALRECASVRLFVDRASLQEPDLVLSDEAIALVASICQRVDGIPFAIELAAARVKMLTIAQIADMLDRMLELAETTVGASRQMTLRTTIKWSHDLLDQDQQILFRRLAVFAGGFTLEAATFVCQGQGLAGEQILDLLTELVGKSLVELDPHPSANRYRLLEATRQFAGERLAEANGEVDTRTSHLRWFLSLAERSAGELVGPRQAELLDVLEDDLENLRVAFVEAQGREAADDLRLAASLGHFWLVRGMLSEGAAWLAAALERDPATTSALRAEALCAAGMLACFAGDFGEADPVVTDALTIARELDSPFWEARARSLAGLVAVGEGRPEDAADLYARAITLSRETSDWWLTAFALTNLGNILVLRGATSEARTRYEESLAIRREHDDAWGLAWSLFRLGTLTTWEGRYDEATRLLDEGLTRSRSIRFQQGTVLALLGLGEAYHLGDDQARAHARYTEALHLARQLEEPTVARLALAGLADVALATHQVGDAVNHLTEGETIEVERAPATLAAIERSRGRLASAQGNDAAAEVDHLAALDLRLEAADRRGLVEQLEELAFVARRTGQTMRSASLLAAAQQARARMGLPVPLVDRADVDAAIEQIRTSDDHAAAAAWDTGSRLSLDEAVSLASHRGLTVVGPSPDAGPHPTTPPPIDVARQAWIDELGHALSATVAPDRARHLLDTYRAAFPSAYWTMVTPESAALDIVVIEQLRDSGRTIDATLRRDVDAAEGLLDLRVFRSGEPLAVADVLPVLDNFGLRVLDEQLHELCPESSPRLWLHDFHLTCDQPVIDDVDAAFALFQAAFAQVWQGSADDDGFNRLVLGAGMEWRDVTVLRAYCRYLLQIGNAFGQTYMERTLSGHPDVARAMVALFRARFDPAESATTDRDRITDGLASGIVDAIDQVTSLDEDRVLRTFLSVIEATLRTNFFQSTDGRPKDRLALKFDPARVPDLPAPRPAFEIFVHSSRVEGVHLRGGKVARGGIRWSDRHDDFRTEVLGLMKAQTVKNVVIVPVGAKGGFVVKRPPADPTDRAALAEEGVACYRAFIRGLLDVTDNLVGGEIVRPPDVVCRDDDDAYLVVAADKGTGSFSDVANEISAQYGFWLGDAFASGGSVGYDHKGMGITSRGAWEAVRCHFRNLGIDADADEITVVGIGDMSGDVFGNGLLRSRHVKLLGAFDHRHIFLDPDPDPERSFAERQRLFDLPRSSWADYDPSLISPGGGVFPRDKRIDLSPELRALLELDTERATPDEVVRSLLRSRVDLFWNGGVGTFVKASTESAADVGDRTNDAIRVDARDLRARVAAEGGNLGWTQRARVEFALGGGLINTDAIDNSAGVDCSDHEVNLKILLDQARADGVLTAQARNELLAAMTDEVAGLLLRDNELQTRALSMNLAWTPSFGSTQLLAIHYLEQVGQIDRELECLPTDTEFDLRRSAGGGLCLPELATLLAHAKIHVFDGLLASDLPEDPAVYGELERYFPERLQADYRDRMAAHPLRREIIANAVTNDLLNRLDVTLPFRLADHDSASLPEIARAYTVVRDALGMPALWDDLAALGNLLPTAMLNALLADANAGVESMMRWMLRRGSTPIDIGRETARLGAGVADLAAVLPDVLPPADREAFDARAAQLREAGLPPDLAGRIAGSDALAYAPDIIELAAQAEIPIGPVASVYFALRDRLDLGWLGDQITALPCATQWNTRARLDLFEDLEDVQRYLATAVVRTPPNGNGSDLPAALDTWLTDNSRSVERAASVLADVKRDGVADAGTLTTALREFVRALTRASDGRDTDASNTTG